LLQKDKSAGTKSVIARPHPNKMWHNVVMTGGRDSSFHFVSFGMTGSRMGSFGGTGAALPPQYPQINKSNCHSET